ncbi:MAG: hypothetical protein FWF25_02985 [Propionibacteriaceae bacterium]|nr:hypothetical protein [Propionibacteriaceae bacterium]
MRRKKNNRVWSRGVVGGDQGMVTVEMAFAALGLGLALAIGTGFLGVVLGQVQCGDAAAQIARQEARDDVAAVNEITGRLPDSASVHVTHESDRVVVTVTIDLRPWGTYLPTFQVHSTASVVPEAGRR